MYWYIILYMILQPNYMGARFQAYARSSGFSWQQTPYFTIKLCRQNSKKKNQFSDFSKFSTYTYEITKTYFLFTFGQQVYNASDSDVTFVQKLNHLDLNTRFLNRILVSSKMNADYCVWMCVCDFVDQDIFLQICHLIKFKLMSYICT